MTADEPDTAPDVAALVRAGQGGDATAVQALVEGHLTLVYTVIGRVLNGDPDVDDLVQETMIQAIRGLRTLRDPDRFRPWLLAIAHRQVQLHLRTRQRALRRRHPEPVDVPDPAGDLAERTVAELELAGQRADLARATGWLDPDDRHLLALWWQEVTGELTRADLAEALGVGPSHAAVRVRRMKSQLDAVRAVVRALNATPRCPDLAELTRRWSAPAGAPQPVDPVWRKRLVRHVRDCSRCSRFRTGLVAPEKLLLGVVALPVPAAVLAAIQAALHAEALRTVAFGPMVVSQLPALLQRRAVAVATTAAAVVAGGGLVFAVHYSPGSPDRLVEPPALVAPSSPAGTAPASIGPTATPTPRPAEGAGAADIFVAPNGSDSGDGSEQRPYASLNKATSVVRPGQTIAVRGGTYRLTTPVDIRTAGTAAQRITLVNVRNERPVLDASGIPAGKWAVTQQTAYWTVQGLEIRNAPTHAWVCRACRDTVFRRISSHHNGRSGLMLRDDGTTNNQVLDSDFYDNRDATGTAGIGLGVQFGAGGGNLIRGNRAYGNAVGGYDLGAFRSPVSVEYNWAYDNDANGFTFGGGPDPLQAAHKVRHNAAWGNTGNGFSNDGNSAALELSNNTAYRNRSAGFSLPEIAAVLRLNVAIDNGDAARVGPTAKADNNSWQDGDSTAALFRSVDASTAEGPRPAGGGLPGTDYLATRNGRGASMSGR